MMRFRKTQVVALLAFATLSALPSAAQTPAAANPLNLEVHHITASATDVDRAVKWYQEMLGFKVDRQGARGNGGKFAELSIPGFGVAFVQQGAPPAAAAAPAAASGTAAAPAPAVPARNRWIHIVFAVPDPAAAFEALKAKGANPRARTQPGQPITTFLVDDSEGNEIEIVDRNAG